MRRPRAPMPACALVLFASLGAAPAPPGSAGHSAPRSDAGVSRTDFRINRPLSVEPETRPARPAAAPGSRPPVVTSPPVAPEAPAPAPAAAAGALFDGPRVVQSLQTVGLFALVSLAPAAVLMVTAFVRINVVLVLLRQALGSPQVPGNQVSTALALLLTALVMRPVGETVYHQAIEPYAAGRVDWSGAYQAGAGPIKRFMLEQIEITNHANYVYELYDLSVPPTAGQPDPVYPDEFPMRVVAPAFLLSELTTALVFGFFLYLPFLVIDLVVAAVLASMGLFMTPPSLVSLPLKLILFVLADGWLHVSTMLLRSFGTVG